MHWQQQHSNPVMCCCGSLDGFHRVAGCEDGTLHVYDVATGNRTRALQSETGEAVNAVEFTIDGRYVVACYGNDVVVWDVLTGDKACRAEDCHSGVIFDVATCPKDARRFATASEDGTAKVWIMNVQKASLTLMHLMRSNTKTGMSSIAWSPDGRFIATGSSPGGIRIWLAATGTPMAVLGDEAQNATVLHWSPGSQYVIAIGGSMDGLIYEPLSKEEPFRLVSHLDSVTACAWSRYGNLIATGDATGNVKLWELVELSSAMSPSSNESSDNAYSSEDEDLGLSEAERELNAHYNMILEQERREREERERQERAALEASREKLMREQQQRQEASGTRGHDDCIAPDVSDGDASPSTAPLDTTAAGVTPPAGIQATRAQEYGTGATMYASSALRDGHVWHDQGDDLIGSPTAIIGTQNEFDLAASEQSSPYSLVNRGSGRMRSVQDIDELENVKIALGRRRRLRQNQRSSSTDAKSVSTTASSEAGSEAGSEGGEGAEDALAVFAPVVEDLRFKHHVTCARLSKTQGKLLVCIRDRGAYVWDDPLVSKCATYVLQGHRANVMCGDWSPTESFVVTGSADCSAVVWDVDTERGGVMHTRLVRHSSDVLCCAWSPTDTNIIATGSVDSTVVIWLLASERNVGAASVLHHLVLHSLYVRSVAFSHDGAMMYSGSSDKTVRCWRVATGKCAFTLPKLVREEESSSVMSVACSPVEDKIVIGYRNGAVRIHNGLTGYLMISLSTGHSSEVWCCSFSPNGQYVLTGSWDKSLRCWSVETGALLWKRDKAHNAGIKTCHWVVGGGAAGPEAGMEGTYAKDGVHNRNSGSTSGGEGGGGGEAGGGGFGHDESAAALQRKKKTDRFLAVSGGMDRAVYIWEVRPSLLEQRMGYARASTSSYCPESPRSVYSVDFKRVICENLAEATSALRALHVGVVSALVHLSQALQQQCRSGADGSSDDRTIGPDGGDTTGKSGGDGKAGDVSPRSDGSSSVKSEYVKPSGGAGDDHLLDKATDLVRDSWVAMEALALVISSIGSSPSASASLSSSVTDLQESSTAPYELVTRCYAKLERVLAGCDILVESLRHHAADRRTGADIEDVRTDAGSETGGSSHVRDKKTLGDHPWHLFDVALQSVRDGHLQLERVFSVLPTLVSSSST